MKKFIYCHFSLFGTIYFSAIVLSPYITPYILHLACVAYILVDTFVYYRDNKTNGKSEYAKALLVYDIIVFCVTNAYHLVFYFFNFVTVLIELGQVDTYSIIHVSISFLLQITYFAARGFVHKKVFSKGKNKVVCPSYETV